MHNALHIGWKVKEWKGTLRYLWRSMAYVKTVIKLTLGLRPLEKMSTKGLFELLNHFQQASNKNFKIYHGDLWNKPGLRC